MTRFLMTTVASFFGASVGIVMMMLFSPLVAEVAFKFGPAEYFSIMALGLVAASVVSSGSAIKGITMVVVGMMLGLVGTDVNSGVAPISVSPSSRIACDRRAGHGPVRRHRDHRQHQTMSRRPIARSTSR